jgi:uncharacterized membrane protein
LFVKRFPFLDWMRGLAVVIMIQCHVFNSFARMDVREGGPYVLSQFVGGMAAPLFLFMAGMTFAFQLDSLERREPSRWRRWRFSLRRAGYILGIAFLFRFTNWVASLPHSDLGEITKVDILNCMGVGMAAVSLAALFEFKGRVRFAVLVGLAIAAAAPILTNLPWGGTPALLQEYLVPGNGRPRFPFFPCASYVGFGLAAGAIVKRAAADRLDRLMQWSVAIGFALVFIAQYFSNLPYSIYPKSDFWRDSPALILIRVGIMLLMMAGAYLWTLREDFADGLLGARDAGLRGPGEAVQAGAVDSANRAGDAPGDARDGSAGRRAAMVAGAAGSQGHGRQGELGPRPGRGMPRPYKGAV